MNLQKTTVKKSNKNKPTVTSIILLLLSKSFINFSIYFQTIVDISTQTERALRPIVTVPASHFCKIVVMDLTILQSRWHMIANLIPVAIRHGVTHKNSQMATSHRRNQAKCYCLTKKRQAPRAKFSTNRSYCILKIDIGRTASYEWVTHLKSLERLMTDFDYWQAPIAFSRSAKVPVWSMPNGGCQP